DGSSQSTGTLSDAGISGGVQLGTATARQLGTGLYRISLHNGNPGRGLKKDTAVAVANGAQSTLDVDMTETTYNISGTVSFQGNVFLQQSTFSVTVSS